MVDSLQSDAVLSNVEIAELYAGAKCAACGKEKPEGKAFCFVCTGGLTWWARNWLSRGPSDPHFADSFRSALRHLLLNAENRRDYYLSRRGWPYKTPEDLDRAGFRFSSHAQCASVRCLASITWYISPAGKFVAVNEHTAQPHSETCFDPDHWKRRSEFRQTQTSARRSKARR